jgi:taurine transport system substrate-binding protein
LKQVEAYQQDPKAFEQNADNIQKIAQLTGSDVKDIPLLLSGNIYLNGQQQHATLSGEFAKNIFDTATFLKAKAGVDQVNLIIKPMSPPNSYNHRRSK